MMSGKMYSTCAVLLCAGASFAADPFYAANGTPTAIRTAYTGNIGMRFGVDSAKIPEGQMVEVTELGFYAGRIGNFIGAGVVDFSHTLDLWGPRNAATKTGDFSLLNLASLTLNAGAAVDANGFAWVPLATPLQLSASMYYVVTSSYIGTTQAADPYFDPNAGPGGTVLSFTPGNPFSDVMGRFRVTSGGEAYSGSGYLGPNLKYQLVPVPEPSIAALAALGLAAFLFRRRSE